MIPPGRFRLEMIADLRPHVEYRVDVHQRDEPVEGNIPEPAEMICAGTQDEPEDGYLERA